MSIAFVAYAIYKELEWYLARSRTAISPERAGELTHTMYELEYTLPDSRIARRQLLAMTAEQQQLYDAVMTIT